MIYLCDKYGWTEEQYLSNTEEFIERLMIKNNIDNEKSKAPTT